MHFEGKYGTILDGIKAERKTVLMTQEKIDRINALARKKKTEGLTPEEVQEQKELREEYVASFRASLRGILDNTVIERPDGSREALNKKDS